MIVYNVKRRWFTEKAEAEKYRVAEGLRPAATLKIEVVGRDDMAALLNALCEPALPGQSLQAPATAELVDRAYVQTGRDIPDCVPDFLLRSHGLSR
jgi:hypothetical protein